MNRPGEVYTSVDDFIIDLKKQIDAIDPYHWDSDLEAFIRTALSHAYMNFWV